MKISDDLRNRIRDAKRADPTLSGSQLGKMFGVHKSTANNIVEDLQTQFLPDPPANVETTTITDTAMEISFPKTQIHTLEQLIEHCQVDLDVWQVDRFLANKWEVGSKDADGNVDVTPLFQVKAFFKRKTHVVDARAEIEALKAEAKEMLSRIWTPKPVVYTTQDSENMLEALLPDLHAAKLAYAKETGFQNYDTEIAIETYHRAVATLVRDSSHLNLSQIVLGVGNDLLQADNIQGTTYSGTKVDVDSRYRKTYVAVRKMLTQTIRELREIAPVVVKVVPGNHDTLSSFTLGDSLECAFDGDASVAVDNSPIQHKIVEWGKCFLMLIHGHAGKQADYGIWMASQYPEAFGRTKFREIHCGHRHKQAVDEKFGIRVRTFSALCPPDEWHSTNGYIGNLRVAEGLVWNKHEGLKAHFYHTEVD